MAAGSAGLTASRSLLQPLPQQVTETVPDQRDLQVDQPTGPRNTKHWQGPWPEAAPFAVPKPGSAILEHTSIRTPSASSHEGLRTIMMAAGVTHSTIASIACGFASANSSNPANAAFVAVVLELPEPRVGALSESEPPPATSTASSSRARHARVTPISSKNVDVMLPVAVGRATASGRLCEMRNNVCECDSEWELPLEASPAASLNADGSHDDRGSFFTDETPAACGDTATLSGESPCLGVLNFNSVPIE